MGALGSEIACCELTVFELVTATRIVMPLSSPPGT